MEQYAAYLQKAHSLILVAVIGDTVVGTGGINSGVHGQFFYYWLSYGLVDPRHQGRGMGTLLLLARVALLPEPASSWPVLLTCVERSRTFYERFGFRHIGNDPRDKPPVAGSFLATVQYKQIRRARTYLRRQGVDLEKDRLEIPFKPEGSDATRTDPAP